MDVINLKGRLNNCNAPRFTRLNDLQPGVPYEITNFAKTNSRYGEAVCASVKGIEGDDVLLNVYLPRRFLTILTEAAIESYNNGDAARMSLLYRGNGRGIEFV